MAVGFAIGKDSLKHAVAKFQEYMGLPKTGKLDLPTKKKMAEPRCGVYDIQAISSLRTTPFKWEKQHLTYSIKNFFPDLPQDDIKSLIKKAFDTWSGVIPLGFEEVRTQDESADIQIKFASGTHGDPWPFDEEGKVIAHATMPTSGLVHFDNDEKWTYMGPENAPKDHIDLFTVAIHEIGHTLGLEHSRDKKSIMTPIYKKPVDSNGNYIAPKLFSDDIKAIQDIYGSRK